MRVTLNKEYGFKRMARIYFLGLILVAVFSTEAIDQTFGSIMNLSATPGESKTAHLVVNGSNIYVVWQDNTPGNWDIFFRHSTDGGATLSPPINLSANPGESRLPHKLGGGLLPAIAVNGTNVYVVWDDDTLGPAGFPDIFYRRSTDGGTTFEPKVNLSANPGVSGGPSVVANGSNVYVIWGDATIVGGQVFSDILYVRSSDGGATFESVQNLSSSPNTYSYNHWIAVSGAYVHVVWSEPSDEIEIFYRRSIDSGATFNPALNLSSAPGSVSLSPSVVLSGSNVYVAWIDGYSGEHEIFFTHSSNNGITFAPAKNLSANVGDDYWYRIAASDQNVYMVWWHNPVYNPYETFYIRSTDGGNTFEPKRIFSSSKRSGDPRLAVDGYKVHAAWTESDYTSVDIFYRRSVNNGATFDSPVNLSASGAVGVFDVVASDGNVYVLWEDHSPGNADIFFRRLSEETIPEGITIYTNQTSYKEGDTLTLSYSISNSGDSFKADVFLGFVLPDESIWFFDESLQNLKPCNPSDSRTYTAAITSLDVSKGYSLPKTPFFSVTLPALPQGTCIAFAALAEPGSAKTGNLALIGDVSLATFTFTGVEAQIDFRFPLSVSTRPDINPYTASISSVLDHSGPFYSRCNDNEIVSYAGEKGIKEKGVRDCPDENGFFTGAYKNSGGTDFIVNGQYSGVSTHGADKEKYLNYDGHSGYDYPYPEGTIIAPRKGKVFLPKEDNVNRNNGKTSPWCGWHTFYIDHGNGWTTWYLHSEELVERLKNAKPANYCESSPQEDLFLGEVEEGEGVAYVGGWGGVSPHLHFEVRKDGKIVDPYGWEWIEPDPIGNNSKAQGQEYNLWGFPTPQIDSIDLVKISEGTYTLTITGSNFASDALITLWHKEQYFTQALTPRVNTGTQLVTELSISRPEDYITKIKNPKGPRSKGKSLK